MAMTEKELDQLAGIGERLGVLRRRLGLTGQEGEDMRIAAHIVNTLVLFADGGALADKLGNAVANQIAAVRKLERRPAAV